jgi:sugar lactone lactonase YvrE
MAFHFDLIDEIAVGNRLGEGVQWRAQDQSLWWTDILGSTLYRLDWQSRTLSQFACPEPVGSFAFTQYPETLIAAFASGFGFFNYNTGAVQWLHRPVFLPGEGRFNDGRADRQGRFWCGTMMAEPGGTSKAAGRLFCLGTDGALSQHEQQINISNGLCWSPDSSILYFADSLKGGIVQYDFDGNDGTLSNKRPFALMPKGGVPDGAAVDADGNVWSAQWGAGKVLMFDKSGMQISEVSIPALQPTCVAFGGPEMDLLFVTSATDGLDEGTTMHQSKNGNVFVFKTSFKGLPECEFTGIVHQPQNSSSAL